RVLRPAGRLALREFLAGPVQPAVYPLPWAESPAISFLHAPADLRGLLAGIGFAEIAWEDLTAPLSGGAPPPPTPGRLPTLGDLLHPEDGPTIRANLLRNYAENRVLIVQAVFQRD